MEAFKAIVFDAYGTLFNINSLDLILEENFGSASGELSAIWRRKQLEYTWLRTLMQRYKPFSEVTMDALRHGCSSLGLQMSQELEERLKKNYLNLDAFEEVKGVLSKLKQNSRLGILSNANPEMLAGAVTHNGLEDVFSHILSAHTVQMYKPRKEVYRLACQAFDCQPGQILFISSNTWDVSGAKSFGLQVGWLKRSQNIREDLGFHEDLELADLAQLLPS